MTRYTIERGPGYWVEGEWLHGRSAYRTSGEATALLLHCRIDGPWNRRLRVRLCEVAARLVDDHGEVFAASFPDRPEEENRQWTRFVEILGFSFSHATHTTGSRPCRIYVRRGGR